MKIGEIIKDESEIKKRIWILAIKLLLCFLKKGLFRYLSKAL
jgi:hypothetical protein